MRVVISLGGSLIVPDEIDVTFLNKFVELIQHFPQHTFGIVCGGGKRAARYIQKAKDKGITDPEKLDWQGIKATKENAELLKGMFSYKAYGVIDNPSEKFSTNKKILIGAGYKPGCSTDADAVLLAENIDAEMVVNMSNIDYAYDKDPNKFNDAKKIEEILWEDFRKIVGDEWSPRMNAPFDPIASKLAEKLKLKVVIIGKDLNNLRNVLEGKEFKGTIIR